MSKYDQILKGIVEAANKANETEMIAVFEAFLSGIKDIKDITEEERTKLENLSNSAIAEIRTENLIEWKKIKERVSQIINGRNGRDGRDGVDGRDGANGLNGTDGAPGKDGTNGLNGKDGSPDTPDQIVEKINRSSLLITKERVEGLLDAIRQAAVNAAYSVGVTTTNFFKDGSLVGRAKNINFIGTSTSVSVSGDQANVTITGGSGSGHTIQDEGVSLTPRTYLNFVGAGVAVTDGGAGPDSTIVTISGASLNFADNETPSGSINSSNVSFTLANTPVAGSVHVYQNGTRRTLNVDYTISGSTITFIIAPDTGDILVCDYRY